MISEVSSNLNDSIRMHVGMLAAAFTRDSSGYALHVQEQSCKVCSCGVNVFSDNEW